MSISSVNSNASVAQVSAAQTQAVSGAESMSDNAMAGTAEGAPKTDSKNPISKFFKSLGKAIDSGIDSLKSKWESAKESFASAGQRISDAIDSGSKKTDGEAAKLKDLTADVKKYMGGKVREAYGDANVSAQFIADFAREGNTPGNFQIIPMDSYDAAELNAFQGIPLREGETHQDAALETIMASFNNNMPNATDDVKMIVTQLMNQTTLGSFTMPYTKDSPFTNESGETIAPLGAKNEERNYLLIPDEDGSCEIQFSYSCQSQQVMQLSNSSMVEGAEITLDFVATVRVEKDAKEIQLDDGRFGYTGVSVTSFVEREGMDKANADFLN